MSRPRLPVLGLLLLILVLAAGAAVGGYAVTDHVRAEPAPSPPAPLPPAYRSAAAAPAPPTTAAAGPMPAAAPLARTLAPRLSAAALGPRVHAEVSDVLSGSVLYRRDPTTPVAPASTAKVLTAAAVLSVRPAGYRIRTTVRRGPGGSVVLVGAGDPTLTAAPAGREGPYREAARISDLAAALRRAGVHPTRIVVDDSLFTGPTVAPQWAPEDVPSDYAAPITPVMVDGGRDTPTAFVRSTEPDLAAGRALAAALGTRELAVVRGRAPAGAAELASVVSAPLATLVEQMLRNSDNVIAEALARQVALAQGRPASFAGGAAAVRAVLARLGLDPGAGMVDSSGLAASDRVPVAVLTGVLRLAAAGDRPGLAALLAGLPVAAWSGTLADRYLKGSARGAAGLVRAKTGTLTGVSALAGTVHDRDGRLLAFAVVADRAPDTARAEAALDGVAAGLASCGCG
jgi:D-alanyl-D-alanine carboxypeptidase/D-alanyl-D-alanine-endopeptidase (penicillin-binding protein 4)